MHVPLALNQETDLASLKPSTFSPDELLGCVGKVLRVIVLLHGEVPHNEFGDIFLYISRQNVSVHFHH